MNFKDLATCSKKFKIIIYKSSLDANEYFFLSTFLNKKLYNTNSVMNRREYALRKIKQKFYRNFSLSCNQLRYFGVTDPLSVLKKKVDNTKNNLITF